MAHHGQGEGPIQSKILEELRSLTSHSSLKDALGDTGRHPQGALTKDDEGELKFAVGRKDSKVVLDFGKPVSWIGFDPDQAIQIAMSLVKQDGQIKGVPMTLRIGRED